MGCITLEANTWTSAERAPKKDLHWPIDGWHRMQNWNRTNCNGIQRNGYFCVSIRRVFLEYPRRAYNGSLEWFTCGKADCETVWGALDGDRPHFCFFKRKHPFPRDFLTYVGFSISSLILNTMLFWCRLIHFCTLAWPLQFLLFCFLLKTN